MMMIPPADLGYIEETFRTVVRVVTEAYEDASEPPELPVSTPEVLTESLLRLLEVLRGFEPDTDPNLSARDEDGGGYQDLPALGDHGLTQLSEFAHWAKALGLPDAHRDIRLLSFSLGIWLIRNGGELSNPETVVDALAYVANQIKSPHELEKMFQLTTECVDAVDPGIAEDLDRSNPGRPWRILLLNRSIIATRSHQPALMEEAFQTLVELLPEDAPNFFSEGMEQMEALDYPDPVREVMEKYFKIWCTPKRLH